MSLSDSELRALFESVATIAVVGFSRNPARPSHYVSEFLVARGYRVIPVNPGLAGQTFFGAQAVASLSEIAEPVDMVDVFRRSEHVSGIVAEVLAMAPVPSVLWTQLGVRDDAAAAVARGEGMTVVQDRCPRIEIPRLFPQGWVRG